MSRKITIHRQRSHFTDINQLPLFASSYRRSPQVAIGSAYRHFLLRFFSERTSIIAIVLLCFAIFSYLYFLNNAILNVVKRKNVEQEITELNSRVIGMENKYISMESEISLERAVALGFHEVSKPLFVARQSGVKSLSLNNEI